MRTLVAHEAGDNNKIAVFIDTENLAVMLPHLRECGHRAWLQFIYWFHVFLFALFSFCVYHPTGSATGKLLLATQTTNLWLRLRGFRAKLPTLYSRSATR